MNKNRNTLRMLVAYLVPMAVILILFTTLQQGQIPKTQMSVNDFRELIQTDRIKTVTQQEQTYRGVLKDEQAGTFEVYVPTSLEPEIGQLLAQKVEARQIVVYGQPKAEPSVFLTLLPDLLLIGLMIFFLIQMNRRSQAQNSGMNAFGKSKARLNRDQNAAVRFSDVAGLKEEKEELMEIVDFLKNPRKFSGVGARIPKGVLLVGPPGTGKTYLSRAVAGEAQVPFYSISGSDFVEMFVGVGASRVRDLFLEGKKNAPCIIFIDEIDAVGRRRGAGLGGGNDEREQTLNQLLVEMDGFDVNEGIIIMAATNRPDILDPAILRPGRFDRQVYVGMPDLAERIEILKVHLRNKKVAESVDLEAIARSTGGFTPADLENVCNEAALLTARQNRTEIDQPTFQEAVIKVVAGPEKKSKRVIEEERRLTAYHEAGHAIVTRALPGTDAVNLITIVPRGRAGGFTAFLPDEDRSYRSRKQMLAHLISFLGGRAAEDLVLDDISTGASNDIERATKLARDMVVRYGMSPTLGPISYEEDENDVFLGKDFGRVRAYSEETAEQIDREVRAMMEKAYRSALQILENNRELLEELAKALLDRETVRREEFEQLFLLHGQESNALKEVRYEFA